MKDTIYNHYIAIDWSIENIAIAHMTKKSNKITAIDVPSDIADLQAYLKKMPMYFSPNFKCLTN